MLKTTLTSAADYVSMGVITVPASIKKLLIQLTEKNVNAVKYKILASNDLATDGTLSEPVTLKAETTITKNAAADPATLEDAWRYVEVQFADNVAATHGSLKCVITGA